MVCSYETCVSEKKKTSDCCAKKSSQELPFRESFACFRGPIGFAFSKIENLYQDIISLL